MTAYIKNKSFEPYGVSTRNYTFMSDSGAEYKSSAMDFNMQEAFNELPDDKLKILSDLMATADKTDDIYDKIEAYDYLNILINNYWGAQELAASEKSKPSRDYDEECDHQEALYAMRNPE